MFVDKARAHLVAKKSQRLEHGLLYAFGFSFLVHFVLFGVEWHRGPAHAASARGLRAQLTQKITVDVPTVTAQSEKAQASAMKQDAVSAPEGSMNPVASVGSRSPWRRQADEAMAEGAKLMREDALLQQSRLRERSIQQEQWLRFNAEEALMRRLSGVQVSDRCEATFLVGSYPVIECASIEDVRKLKTLLRGTGPLISARGFSDVSIFVLSPGEGVQRMPIGLK